MADRCICAGEADEMHDAAMKGAEEIPGARFVSLPGHSHISTFYEADDLLLPHILELLRLAAPTSGSCAVRGSRREHADQEQREDEIARELPPTSQQRAGDDCDREA